MFEPLKQVEWGQGKPQPQDLELVGAVAFTPGEVGYINSSGQVAKALATGTTTIPVCYVSVNGCGVGGAGIFRPWGVVVCNDWTWTPGSKIYLSTSTAGALTASAPTTYILPVGQALSATAINFFPSLQNDYTPNTRDDDTALAEGVDIATGTVTGSKFGTSTQQKLGFWNKTPVVQPVGATQAAAVTTVGSAVATTTGTAASTTTGTAASTTTGTGVDTTVITTAAVTAGAGGAYAFADATQADGIAAVARQSGDLANVLRSRVDELISLSNTNQSRVSELISLANTSQSRVSELIDLANTLQTRVNDLITAGNLNTTALSSVIGLTNQLRSDLVTIGAIKGAA